MKHTIHLPNDRWDMTPPWWTNIFLNSNDQISHYSEIVKQLQCWKQEELELISVVGGMNFLRLLQDVEFERITLFDRNINELTKWIMVRDYLENTPYEQYDHFASLHRQWQNRSHLLPRCAKDIEVEGGRRIVELGPLTHPQFDWKPTQSQYEKVQKSLNRIDTNLYLRFPHLDVQGRVVVAYMSNIQRTTNKSLRNDIENQNVVIPIWADCQQNPNGKNIWRDDQLRKRNAALLDPHLWWEAMVKRYWIKPCIQVWPPNSPGMVNSWADKMFDKGMTSSQFAQSPTGASIVTHIFYGREKDNNIAQQALQITLRAAKKVCQRIIVTEHNRASGLFPKLKHLPSGEEIIQQVRTMIEPSFSLKEIR